MSYLIIKRTIQNTLGHPQFTGLNEKNSTLYWKCAAILVAWLMTAFIQVVIFFSAFATTLSASSEYVLLLFFVMAGKFNVEQFKKNRNFPLNFWNYLTIIIDFTGLNYVFTIIWWRSVNTVINKLN